MIRILHAADLHLDSPFAALGPDQAAQRREEQRQMLRRLCEAAQRRDCQLLLLAGDLFDCRQVYRETAELLRDLLGQMKCRVFIAPGNHDPWSPESPYASLDWPENVHIFRSGRVEAVRLEEPAVTVYGAAFTEPRSGSLLKGFHAQEEDRPKIMVLHGTLGDPASVYNPVSAEEAAASGLDYLALGHVHSGDLQIFGRTTAAYPGCPMGRGFDETGSKGALYIEVDGSGCQVERVPLGGRRYERLRVRAGSDPLSAILEELPADTGRDIYRITLTGPCPSVDLRALRTALAPRFFGLELIDATQPPQALWQGAAEDSLRGEFLRRLKACYDGETEPEARRLVTQALRLGLAVLDGREVPEL